MIDRFRAHYERQIELAQTDVTLASHGDGDPTGELAERLAKAKAALAQFEEEQRNEDERQMAQPI